MSTVIVTRESTFNQRGYIDEMERHFITVEDLADIVNSANDGKDERREYILIGT